MFKNVFNYKMPDEMVKYLQDFKTNDMHDLAFSFVKKKVIPILKIVLKLCQNVMKNAME